MIHSSITTKVQDKFPNYLMRLYNIREMILQSMHHTSDFWTWATSTYDNTATQARLAIIQIPILFPEPLTHSYARPSHVEFLTALRNMKTNPANIWHLMSQPRFFALFDYFKNNISKLELMQKSFLNSTVTTLETAIESLSLASTTSSSSSSCSSETSIPDIEHDYIYSLFSNKNYFYLLSETVNKTGEIDGCLQFLNTLRALQRKPSVLYHYLLNIQTSEELKRLSQFINFFEYSFSYSQNNDKDCFINNDIAEILKFRFGLDEEIIQRIRINNLNKAMEYFENTYSLRTLKPSR